MSTEPKYRLVLRELAARIDSGWYFSGGREGRLDSINDMAKEFEVSPKTVQLALVVLVDRGVIRPHQGKAYYVVSSSSGRSSSPGGGSPDG